MPFSVCNPNKVRMPFRIKGSSSLQPKHLKLSTNSEIKWTSRCCVDRGEDREQRTGQEKEGRDRGKGPEYESRDDF
jgi:hypothetical protein